MFIVPAKKLLQQASDAYGQKASVMRDRSAMNAQALALFLASCVSDEEAMTFEQARSFFAFCACGVAGALVGMFEPQGYAPSPPTPPQVPTGPVFAAPQQGYAPPFVPYPTQPQGAPQAYAPSPPQSPQQYAPQPPQGYFPPQSTGAPSGGQYTSAYSDVSVSGPNGQPVGGPNGSSGAGTVTYEITDPANGTVQKIQNGQFVGTAPLTDQPLPGQRPPVFGGM